MTKMDRLGLFFWVCSMVFGTMAADAPAPKAAQATPETDVTGYWSGTFPVGEEEAPFVLDLQMDSDGTLSGTMYDAVYLETAITGTVDGVDISFRPDPPRVGGLSYSGTIDDANHMSGRAACGGCPPPQDRGAWAVSRTPEGCDQPLGYFVLDVTATSCVVTIFFDIYGGIVRVIRGTELIDEMHQGPGAQTFEIDDLDPETTYTLCFFNHCELSYGSFSLPFCRNVTTRTQNCRPPESVEFSEITSNSFVLEAIFGNYGGKVMVSSDVFTGEYAFGPGLWRKTIQGLPADTEFSVMLTNLCEDGSFSDETQETVTTRSNAESNGILTAPYFIDESDVRVTPDLTLELTLEDPNADGWDRFGQTSLLYEVRLVQDCELVFSADVSASQYPARFELDTEIPEGDYEIHVLRKTQLTKNGDQVSSGTVIVGPPAEAPLTQINADFLEIDRWIMHVPKISGGFSGTLVFQNAFPELPAKIWVAGFNHEGSLVTGSVCALIVVGARAELPVYAAEGVSQALFDPALTDEVSHLGLYEESGTHQLDVAITYQNIASPEALTATLGETELSDGTALGAQLLVEARDSPAYWDGLAILNLVMDREVSVTVVQRESANGTMRGSVPLGTVESGEKKLIVISDWFTFCPDCYYTVETAAPNQLVEVLGLRGSLVSDPAVLVQSQVRKVK